METRSYLLIVNPNSGSRRHRDKIGRVQAYFARHGARLEVVYTKKAGDAEVAARLASKGAYRAVIGAGGDGTINEVLNGLAGTGLPVGILPWGTANVFSTEMGFPSSLGRQCQVILRGRCRDLDVGRCNGRAFVMMAGIGFDAYSVRQVLHLKRSLGGLAYAVAAVRALWRYRQPKLQFSLAGGDWHSASFIVVSNTSRYGGLFSLTPQANPTDGKLDIYIYRERGRWRILKLGLSLLLSFWQADSRFRRRLLYLREAIVRANQISITANYPTDVQLDGDYVGQLPVQIGVEPAAARLILPIKAWRRLRQTD